jgi:hypothetical protein
VERFVEAERRLHLRDHLVRGFGRHQHVDRVAGHDVHEAEHDEGHADEDRDGLEQSPEGEDEHARANLLSLAFMLQCSISPHE